MKWRRKYKRWTLKRLPLKFGQTESEASARNYKTKAIVIGVFNVLFHNEMVYLQINLTVMKLNDFIQFSNFGLLSTNAYYFKAITLVLWF